MNEKKFNPVDAQINYTLNINQVNLILEGLGKLQFDRVEQIYNGIRSVALCTLQKAELAHKQDQKVETIVETGGRE